jgi:predicted nucleic acid-binding protein
LLPARFGRITVPEAVVKELEEGRQASVPLPDVTKLDWVRVAGVSAPAVLPLVHDLGQGEREVLALALERPDARVLLDDRLARRVAEGLNIPLTGTLGVLLLAKNAGHLPAVGPIVDRRDALGFRLDPQTRAAVVRLAGEGT